MLHAEPFETHLLSSELCVLFIYFLKGNCIGLEYHIILSKIHIIVIIKTKIIDQNKSCSNRNHMCFRTLYLTEDECDTKIARYTDVFTLSPISFVPAFYSTPDFQQ